MIKKLIIIDIVLKFKLDRKNVSVCLQFLI